jgi:hypothetical protein
MKSGLVVSVVGLSVALLAWGCFDGDETHKVDLSRSAELRPLTEAETSALKLPPGVKVVGALPSIVATGTSGREGKRLQDITVGGPYGSVEHTISDSYYRGFSGRAGAFIDAIQFFGASGSSGAFGGGGGDAFSLIDCPDRLKMMVGIYGRAGFYIDQLGAICAARPSSNSNVSGVGGRVSYTFANTSMPPTISTYTVGGNGGDFFEYICPNDSWIVGWSIVTGLYVDRLTAYCGSGN